MVRGIRSTGDTTCTETLTLKPVNPSQVVKDGGVLSGNYHPLKVETMSAEIEMTESSGNVFADLGLPNPEEALAKAELAIAINRTMEERDLTERQAATILGTSQSRLHNVRRGRLTGVSTDWLLHALNTFGLDIEISVTPKSQHRAHGRTTVATR